MLVQSTTNDVYILPALPADKWANGSVKGLRARGGVTIDMCWEEGDLQQVRVWSKDHSSSVKRLHYRGTTVPANISSGIVYVFDGLLRCVTAYSSDVAVA